MIQIWNNLWVNPEHIVDFYYATKTNEKGENYIKSIVSKINTYKTVT